MDPFTRKEWYDIKAPSMFTERVPGKTPVTRTTGQSEFGGWKSWGEGGGEKGYLLDDDDSSSV